MTFGCDSLYDGAGTSVSVVSSLSSPPSSNVRGVEHATAVVPFTTARTCRRDILGRVDLTLLKLFRSIGVAIVARVAVDVGPILSLVVAAAAAVDENLLTADIVCLVAVLCIHASIIY